MTNTTGKQYHKEYFKLYYLRNKEHIIKKNALWRKNNPSKARTIQAVYRVKQSDRYAKYYKDYYTKRRQKLMEILNQFACVRCGYNESIYALQFDHKNDDRHKELRNRRSLSNVTFRFKSTDGMYTYYIKHPEEARQQLQVLCANCNTIKRITNVIRKPNRTYQSVVDAMASQW